jgi:hypothetical protein
VVNTDDYDIKKTDTDMMEGTIKKLMIPADEYASQ